MASRARVSILLILVSCRLAAFEGGYVNYLPGFYGDFSMAVIPETGTYLNNFFSVYQDHSGQVQSLVEIPGIIHATGYEILGGHFNVGIYPGLLAVGYEGDDLKTSRVGLTDIYLMPAAITWKTESVYVIAFEGILAPTGFYQKDTLNTGLNFWTFDHNVAVTWYLPADNEISVNLGYMNNLKNPANDYHSGDVVHIDYLLGHYVNKEVGLGVVGSYYAQATADHAPQAVLVTERAGASTIGPALMYAPEAFNNELIFTLKWQHEFDVSGRPALDYLTLRIWRAF